MTYTLDASALLAWIQKERGGEKVKKILKEKPEPFMHAINFLEVEYKSKRIHPNEWEETQKLLDKLPITIAQILTSEVTDYARYLKAKYPLSLGDSIGLGLNYFLGTTFLTADRHELEIIAKREKVKIEFLR